MTVARAGGLAVAPLGRKTDFAILQRLQSFLKTDRARIGPAADLPGPEPSGTLSQLTHQSMQPVIE
ncbi:hypothetical protein BH23PLA1_BH23PLA1_08060 [soil metagenome]